MLDDAEKCFANVATAISKRARLLIVCPDSKRPLKYLKDKVPADRMRIVEVPTNDTWARDFGPITTINRGRQWNPVNFQFNGWGLKFPAYFDNQVNLNLWQKNVFRHLYDAKDWVLEGGSIDSDGQGTLLTTAQCLLSPNRNAHCGTEEIEQRLSHYFGNERTLWLEHGALEGDDTDSHVDTLARFLPGNQIAYAACDREDDSHYAELRLMEQELGQMRTLNREPYKLVALPIPKPIYDQDGQRLPATYANFLILNGAIILPIYGDDHYDKLAIARLMEACPDYEIVPVNCLALIQQHGSLHCITMQLPFLPQVFNEDNTTANE